MKFVDKLNFEKYFDGIFIKNSSNKLKLEEISAVLRARMEEERMRRGGFSYAPNDYEIHINPKDYRNLKAAAPNGLNGYFKAFLAQEAELRGYTFTGGLSVRFVSDKTLAAPDVKIMTGFAHDKNELPETVGPGKNNPSDQTKVFEKFDITLPLSEKPILAAAVISVVDGPNKGMSVEFADTRINIGRRPSNEMVLSDKSSSRLHAYIVREKGTHVIYDAQSLNGTYVNGEHIAEKNLVDGDEIKIGDTVILYKMK